jgi:hypothetical protein
MVEESERILPEEESRLLLGEGRPFSLAMEEGSAVVDEVGRCNWSNLGTVVVGEETP